MSGCLLFAYHVTAASVAESFGPNRQVMIIVWYTPCDTLQWHPFLMTMLAAIYFFVALSIFSFFIPWLNVVVEFMRTQNNCTHWQEIFEQKKKNDRAAAVTTRQKHQYDPSNETPNQVFIAVMYTYWVQAPHQIPELNHSHCISI